MSYQTNTNTGMYCGYVGSDMAHASHLSMSYPPAAAGTGMNWSQSHAMYPPAGYPPPGYQQQLPPHPAGAGVYGYNPCVVAGGHVPPLHPAAAGYYNSHVENQPHHFLAPPLPPAPHPSTRHNYHNNNKRGR